VLAFRIWLCLALKSRGQKPEAGLRSSPAKVGVSLPNGVKLTLECSDVDTLATIIVTLGHVQTGCWCPGLPAPRTDRLPGRHQQPCGFGPVNDGT